MPPFAGIPIFLNLHHDRHLHYVISFHFTAESFAENMDWA